MSSKETRSRVTLGELLAQIPDARLRSGDPSTEITGIAFDSRRVQPGDLFVAIPGFKRDGRQFAEQAVERGAVAIASEAPLPDVKATALIEVASARAALADLSAAFYGHPSRLLTLVGVTGTDGKTTTAHLLSAVLQAAGRRTGWLTTVDLKIGDQWRPNDLQHTTPEAVGVQKFLAELVEAQVEVGILEVSSHALALDRVRDCEFDLGVFTNLSPEHLNFHGSMEDYLEAKANLFRQLAEVRSKPGRRCGIINADDAASERLRQVCRVPVLSYGLDSPADVAAKDLKPTDAGTRFLLATPTGEAEVSTRLLGRFNVLNWLAAAAAAHVLGVGPETVARAAASLPAIRGRMEPIERGQLFRLLVDFAHTPQALSTALRTLRQHTEGRVLLVFGNAGERDTANRPEMGRIAAQMADFFVISMDDPLHEDPAAIAAAAADGARRAGAVEGQDFVIELDRRRAIQLVVEHARPRDSVLLAGKGHEPRMLVGNKRLRWDDRRVAEEALEALIGARNS